MSGAETDWAGRVGVTDWISAAVLAALLLGAVIGALLLPGKDPDAGK